MVTKERSCAKPLDQSIRVLWVCLLYVCVRACVRVWGRPGGGAICNKMDLDPGAHQFLFSLADVAPIHFG